MEKVEVWSFENHDYQVPNPGETDFAIGAMISWCGDEYEHNP